MTPTIHDFRPDFDNVIGVHPKGYRVRHLGIGRPDEKTGLRVLDEFVQADCPNDFYHARVAAADYDGDISRARIAAVLELVKMMAVAVEQEEAIQATANDDTPETTLHVVVDNTSTAAAPGAVATTSADARISIGIVESDDDGAPAA